MKAKEINQTMQNANNNQPTESSRRISVESTIMDSSWEEQKDVVGSIKKTIETAIHYAESLPNTENKNLEVSLALASDDLIRVLNKEYRNIDKATNVLSFAQHDDTDEDDFSKAHEEARPDTYLLGDIILSYETIVKEAQEQNKTIYDHTMHMLVHGTLHLLGYDHEEENQATIMEGLEVEILQELNIANPYTESI